MHSQAYLAAACALLGAAAASPAPRGLDTVTHIDWVTEIVTSTVWVDASDPRATQTQAPVSSASTAQHNVVSEHQSHSHSGDQHSHGHESSSSSSSVLVAPSPQTVVPAAFSSSSSVLVPAPATSSTSAVPPPPPPQTTTTPAVATSSPVAPSSSTAAGVGEQPAAGAPSQSSSAVAAPAASSTAAKAPNGATPYDQAKLTFYGPEGGIGSCGWPIQDTDLAVAVSELTMDKATMCGKMITITLPGHEPVVAKVVDTCPGCPAKGLDLTSSNNITKGAELGAWKQLDLTNDLGPQYDATWWFN